MFPDDRMYRQDPLIDHFNPDLPKALGKLDDKDQYIVELASKNGFLVGRNSILENDNQSLQRRVKEQEGRITEGMAENKRQRERLDSIQDERYVLSREVARLKQYEPKDEPAEGDGSDDVQQD